MHKEEEGIIVVWRGRGFGESIYASLLCHILNDNGVKAVFRDSASTKRLLDVPMYDPRKHGHWGWWKWRYDLNDIPIMQQNLERASKWLGKEFIVKRDHIPVAFEKMAVPKVDVALNTKTSLYTPYKLWPHLNELKIKMAKLGITYYDLDASETYGIECLNIVKRAQIYLGLDSGMSHYVSRFANGKTLILNGGFVTFNFWAFLYDYEPIQVDDVPCRPCYINRFDVEDGKGCEYNNRCMGEITVDMVFNKICERLGK